MNRIKQMINTREAKKLWRNKLALVALAIIMLYLLAALFVMAGGISRVTCDTVIGPNKMPGFYRQDTPEKRYENSTKKFLTKVKRALAAEDVEGALSEVSLGPFTVVNKSPAELEMLVAEVDALAGELNESPNLDIDPSLLPKIADLEAAEAQLKAPLTAWQQFVYDVSILLGTDAQGRSIFLRGIYSIKIAIQIGLVTAIFAVSLGAFLGAAAGYFGGWVDHVVVWIYTTFSSIPNLVLLVVLAYAFTNSAAKDTLLPVYIAFGATFWIGTCRVIRGETLKLKEMEYVHAAQTAGFGPVHILLRYILPNTAHLMLINFSLLLIAAIKSEVILSYLGFGVKNQPSWGIMIRDAGNNGDVVGGFFWEIGFATALMFVLVLAFNILSDALQDAFDPKHV